MLLFSHPKMMVASRIVQRNRLSLATYGVAKIPIHQDMRINYRIR